MKKYCVISAVGKQSLHRQWIKELHDFDLHLIVYDDSFNKYRNDSFFVTHCKGYKLKLVHDYFDKNKEYLDKYDYFFIPDDDILIDAYNINTLFKYMINYNLDVAQPGLSDSYYTYNHTMQCRFTLLRYTNFVEMMAPCFSRAALKKVLFTFNENTNGWGCEFHWSKLIGFSGIEMAIIDDIEAVHTRPVQSYSEQNMRELNSYISKYNLSTKIKDYGNVINESYNSLKNKKWKPIITDVSHCNFFEKHLDLIANLLLKNIRFTKDPGLFEGKTGISLFFLNYYKFTGKRKFLDIALTIFESTTLNLNLIIDNNNFANGLSGISWYVEYMAQHGYIENDTDEILEEICVELNKINFKEVLDINLHKGLIGYGMHFLSRMSNPLFSVQKNAHLQEAEISYVIIALLNEHIQKLKLKACSETFMINDVTEVILFLCKFKKRHINNLLIKLFLDECVCFLKKLESVNDISNLYKAYSIFQASKTLNDKKLEKLSIDIALKTIEIKNPTPINKTMWKSHLYNYFYQGTSIEAFRVAALAEINRTFDRSNTENLVENILIKQIDESKIDVSILSGFAGMGLILISAMTDYKSDWDNCLLF